MCEWGRTVMTNVKVPAGLSHTGEERWVNKPVDSCIAPLVQALNEAGIHTSGSCCGHGRGPGSILLHDGRELTVTQDRAQEESR